MTNYRLVRAVAGAVALAAVSIIPSGPALADSIRDQQWYLRSLRVAEAQEITLGSGVTVAVLDTGVSPHRDLKPNLLAGTDLLTGKPNGQSDKAGHGTDMAGLIAAPGRGGDGVLGIAPAAKLLPIKVSNSEVVEDAALVDGINYAVAHKVGVLNIAIGGAPAFALVKAIKTATSANIVVVAGSGNDSAKDVVYPAAADGVLAVGATDKNGKHWSDSNTGPQVQICAPGVDIMTTHPGNRYATADGTSDSTAIVSGAVALVRAKFPHLSAAEVIHRITATADDLGPPGRDDECGYGELNIVKALTADVPPLSGSGPSASAPASAATPAGSPPVGTAPAGSAPAGNGASPVGDGKGSSAAYVVGVVVVVLLAGGIVGLVAVRRRRL